MPEQFTKHQHYVPQFYLKLFSADGKSIYAYDRKNEIHFTPSIESICRKNYLYETKWEDAVPELGNYIQPNIIEHTFSRQEGEWSTLFRRLIERSTKLFNTSDLIERFASQEDLDLLAKFAAIQYLRDPHVFTNILQNDYNPEVIKDIPEVKFIAQLLPQIGMGKSKPFMIHSAMKGIFDFSLEGSPAYIHYREFLSMNVTFFYSNQYDFMISSSPIQIFSPQEDDSRLLVWFPISPSLLAVYSNADTFYPMRNQLRTASPQFTQWVNCGYLQHPINHVQQIFARKKTDIPELLQYNERLSQEWSSCQTLNS